MRNRIELERMVQARILELQTQWAEQFPKEEDEVTPEVIAERAAEIRQTWDEETEIRRRVWTPIEWNLPRMKDLPNRGKKKKTE